MKSNVLIFTMLSSLMLLFSCSKDDGNTGGGMSTLQIRMTDAPGPYDEVNVDIQQVEVHSDVNGWQTLNVNAGIYNLLDYMN